ncbi:MAG: hypothetical protein DI535_24500 [Citrobacter freundii]|nr:MAG: hypothetical protein DI535_24500 [Citrobacter freundii]
MKKGTATYQLRHHLISLLMLVTLLWLTISTPFVVSAQLKAETQKTALISAASSDQHDDADDEQSCTALGGTTEEKTSNGFNTLSEEYLHTDSELFHLAELFLNHTRTHTFAEYVAFHGEMLCPPPNHVA